jgi:hypothetical protein
MQNLTATAFLILVCQWFKPVNLMMMMVMMMMMMMMMMMLLVFTVCRQQ